MSSSTIAAVFGWSGIVVGLLPTYQQLRRAIKVSTHGIAIDTWSIFTWINFYWIAYGLALHGVEVWIGAVVTLPLQIGVVLQLEPRKNMKRILATGFLLFLTCWLPTFIWGWKIGVLGIGLVSIINRLPQINECIRAKDVQGVSVPAWLWGSACNGLWCMYFVFQHDTSGFVVNIIAVLLSLFIAYLAFRRQRQWAMEHPVTI